MDNTLVRGSIFLAVIGLLVSIYMTIFKLTSNETMCLGSGGCASVNTSRYSEVSGIPVALIGVAGYASILTLHFLERKPGFFNEQGPLLLFGISLTGFLFNIYLIYVETFLIKAYCPFCITSQIAMSLIFILALIRLIQMPGLQEDKHATH